MHMTLTPEVLGTLGIAAALVVYIWLDQRERNKKTEELIQTKASIEMVEGLRDEVREQMGQIAEKIDKIRDSGNGTVVALAEIKVQMGRLVSNAESEKGTRARQDERLERLFFGEIRALRDSIRGYGRRRSDPPDTNDE